MTQTTNQGMRDFLNALFGKYFQEHDGYVELRLVPKEEGPPNSFFYRRGEISSADWHDTHQANGTHHIYFGVNPRPLSKEKKQSDIKDVVCLWADVDGKDFDGGKEEALQRVEAFPSPPTYVNDSGHGYHCYWVLETPIVGLDDGQRLAFKQILSGVVKEIGGDRSKLHLDACLRLPGTFNIKGSEPMECRVLQLNEDKTYKLEDFAKFKDYNFKESKGADSSFFYYNLGLLYADMKNWEKAVEYGQKAYKSGLDLPGLRQKLEKAGYKI